MKDILKGAIIFGLFLVPCLTLYVENDFFFPYITGKNFAFRIIVEIIFALWIILALSDRSYRPRFSWIMATFTGLLAVMAVSTIMAEHVTTAFWSNFERMDGYITLLHMFAYSLVLGCMFKTKEMWLYFLHATTLVATWVAIKGFSQFAAADGGSRIDSTLGNAAYMAVYMLFHIFILGYLSTQIRDWFYRSIYAVLGCMFVFVLLQTGTRGTFIGLVVGAIVTVGYIAIFSTRYKQVRRYAIGSCAALVLAIGGFMAVRDSAYVQQSPALSRIANINVVADLQTRSMIWGMSFEGIKERPLFGWGSGNFNYVFNSQYDPRIYSQEQWFDRVHNIFFDWLIAGGIFGFLAYFSIFAAVLYYLLVRPLVSGDESFSVFERAVLLGLIAGYLTHNLVVFDNIVSYIFFGTILALIHVRVSKDIPSLQKFSLPTPILAQVIAPIILVVMMVSVYTFNVPGIKASGELIDAFRVVNTNPAEALEYFNQALDEGSFAQQEIVEQLAQQAMNAVSNQNFTPEVRAAYASAAETKLKEMIEEKPGDARLHVFFSGFYRSANQLEKAKEQIDIARTLSPNKQTIILQQGALALSMGDLPGAVEYFKVAYELDTRNDEAREYYIAALYSVNDTKTVSELLAGVPDTFYDRLARNDFVVNSINTAGDFATLANLYERRVTFNTTNPQEWASLAFVYHKLNDVPKAVDSLNRAAQAIPSFTPTAKCISDNIVAGRSPELNCVATTTAPAPVVP